VLNAVTVDVEEWFDTVLFKTQPPGAASNLPANVNEILRLLGKHAARATFFILGSVARSHPETVRRIAAAGHEVASHGDTHAAVFRMNKSEFKKSLEISRDTLAALTGKSPAGYRAPTFSIGPDAEERLAAIKDAGYTYDSSLYPLPFSGRRREPHERPCGLIEFPPSVFSCCGLKIPFFGGSFLRLLPESLAVSRLAALNAGGLPGMLYFHSWEFEKTRPPGAGLAAAVGQFLNSASVPRKVDTLLGTFNFAPAGETLGL
jgi:polysaccharide deacetylase family protein (PEP-CTERM system associated)